jgi:CelD/BcsL family acetyltransferase involved in cellulose biosynthesis
MLTWRVESVDALQGALAGELRSLWAEAPQASPFCAASFLGVMLGAARREGLLALGRRADGSLAGVWPLRLTPSRRLELLQGPLVDHCAALAAAEVEAKELGRGLVTALTESGARGVFLDHLPAWGPTLAGARAGLREAGWRYREFASNPCPVVAVDPGPDLAGRLVAQANRHPRVRSYANRLQRQPGFAFEILEDASGLERWAWHFFDAHEWRWDATPTPSQYRFRERREHVLACLAAWQREGMLVRFSIRLGGAPLALVAALRAGERLIYHLVVTPPSGAPHRAGHVLIRLILLWMSERGLRILDFGIGDEDYKLRYANRDETLWRVYASRTPVGRSLVVGSLEARIRGSRRLQSLWDEWGNRRIRGTLLDGLRRARIRLRILGNALLGGPARVRRAHAWLTGGRELLYRARAVSGGPERVLTELGPFEALEVLEREAGLLASTRARLYEAAQAGARAFGVHEEGRIVQLAWLEPAPPEPATAGLDLGGRVWLIRIPWTARAAHGCGLHAQVSRSLLGVLPVGDWAMVRVPEWDASRRRGLVEAGFEPVAPGTAGRALEDGLRPVEGEGGRGG